MKYIDANRLKEAVEKKYNSNDTVGDIWDLGYDTACEQILDIIDSLQQEQDLIVINKKDCEAQEQFRKNKDFGKPLQQEQPNKESLNESQQEFVNVVTERMLKEGPIPTLKGKQKAEFEKEFNRFKQITGMINFPANMEVYKRVILWFMAWGADNLPNLNKATGSDELDFQQEQPEQPIKSYDEAYLNEKIAKASKTWEGVDVDKYMAEIRGYERPEVDLKKEIKEWVDLMVGASFPEQDGDYISEEDYRSVIRQTALHFYELGLKSK